MLKPPLMKHARLLLLVEDLPRASLALAETGSFHPDPRPPEVERFGEQPGQAYRETFVQASARLDKILRLMPLPADDAWHLKPHVVDLAALKLLNDWLGDLWNQTSAYEEDLRRLDEAARLVHEQQTALANFADLHIDLGLLRTKTRFLNFHVGTVPDEHLRQLEGAAGLAGHLLHVYMRQGGQAHVVIVGPPDAQDGLTAVLNAAGFRNLPIPDTLDREPARLQEDFAAQLERIDGERRALLDSLAHWSIPFRERLLEARRILILAEPLVRLDRTIRSTAGQIAHLAGWVPARAAPDLERRLNATLTHPFDLSVRDPRPDEFDLVPTLSSRNRLLAPFAMLVRQYGIPRYGEVDPTPIFAVTFLLMFGSMFGDLGQGAVIALAAWAFRKPLGRFWPFGLMAGASSMVFGLLYGSIFGYEHVLPALWMSPLQDPLLMMRLALVWGVIFILIACLLAIYNRWSVGDRAGAILGHHGLVNLIFYLALVAGLAGMSSGGGFGTGGGFGLWPALLAAGALAILAVHSWRHQRAPPGEKILVVFIETLETVIGYLSNTLSFLRVAAFGLNHVALSIAVFTLADMMGAFGHVVTIVLGNLFVIVLEGGIVMIQVMRLQYYEGFSRYFSGEGHAFAPLRLGHAPPAARRA